MCVKPFTVMRTPKENSQMAIGRTRTMAGLDRLDEAWAAGHAHWLSLSSSARLVPVADTGHTIQVDQPAAVVEQIGHLLR